ncbi:hypothetical protein HY345_02965 [Candidatus Microgenomates bacterium]|nr:hypothetical protein [Candidatus Microgenomates bacterium]
MAKDFDLPFEKFDLPEALRTPEVKDVLGWQKIISYYVGSEQFNKWQKEPFEMAPNARPVIASDNKFSRLLGVGMWQVNKFTPTLNELTTTIGLGGWCTFSEGDTQSIYEGKFPDGRTISSAREIIDFLYQSGNRWEQVVRSISPLGISQNEAVPTFIVIEDSLWAERISTRLGKPEWKDELQNGFKAHAQETSEQLIINWLAQTSGTKRKIFFFYTSDLGEYFTDALEEFKSALPYRESREILDNMPVILMYTGYWLKMLKRIGLFRNSGEIYRMPESANALIAEVDSHFRLRGKENDYLGSFFWQNPPGAKDKDNPNRKISMAGYFQPRIPNENKKLLPAYTVPYWQTVNAGNRAQWIVGMTRSVVSAEKIYPYANPVAMEAISSLCWDPEARSLLEYLTLLPKDGLEVKQNSARAVEGMYLRDAKLTLLKLLGKLNDLYKTVGYK